MERSDILERVKKLLALSKSNNLNEAEAALEKAQELMVAHHITEAEAMAQGAKAFAMAEHMAGPAASAALVSIQKKQVWELETFKRDQLTDPGKPVPKAKPVQVDQDAFMDGLNAGLGIQLPGARALHPPTHGAISMGRAV